MKKSRLKEKTTYFAGLVVELQTSPLVIVIVVVVVVIVVVVVVVVVVIVVVVVGSYEKKVKK